MVEYSIISIIVVLIGLSLLIYKRVPLSDVISYLIFSTVAARFGVILIKYWADNIDLPIIGIDNGR